MYFRDAIDFDGLLAKELWDLISWLTIFVKSRLNVGIGMAGQNLAISINIPGFSVDEKFKLIILYNRIKFYIIERKERGEKVWSAKGSWR